jgi:hypothetical protein
MQINKHVEYFAKSINYTTCLEPFIGSTQLLDSPPHGFNKNLKKRRNSKGLRRFFFNGA